MFEDCPTYLENIGLLEVWDNYRDHGSGNGMVVIDSCIDNIHPAFQSDKSQLVEKIDRCILSAPSRENFKDEDSFNNAIKNFLHGTAIAGIILGRPGVYDNIKVCGVDLSNNIRIFAYDAFKNTDLTALFENSLDKDSVGDTDIEHFTKSGKKIWNSYKKNTLISSASLTQELLFSKKEWTDILDVQCKNTKTILVAAVGNDNVYLEDYKDKYFPANLRFSSGCYDFLVRVGSIEYDASGNPQKAAHSNFGSEVVDIMAPGKSIAVIQPNSHAQIGDGTSYAAPIVTATIEMMLKCKISATSRQVKDALFKSADKYDHLKVFVKEGRVVNVKKAIDSFCKRIPKQKSSTKGDKEKEDL